MGGLGTYSNNIRICNRRPIEITFGNDDRAVHKVRYMMRDRGWTGRLEEKGSDTLYFASPGLDNRVAFETWRNT
jgi:hypothetical protein